MASHNGSGFSLIELLVVLVIVVVLAAMLLPAINTVRTIAYRTACGSNLRQIGLGLMTYLDDYQQMMPPARIDPPETALYGLAPAYGAIWWFSSPVVGSYTDHDGTPNGLASAHRVLRCPSDKRPKGGSTYQASYALNMYFTTTVATSTDWASCYSATRLTNRPSTVLVVESEDPRFHPGYGTPPPTYGNDMGTGTFTASFGQPLCPYNWVRRHGTGCNALFADGHVTYEVDLRQDVQALQVYVR